MPRYTNRRRNRRIDQIRVVIEDVNLNAHQGPMAQGRARDHGLFDIDLSHGIGGNFPTVEVGQSWWIKRGGRAWVLDHKVDPTRTDSDPGGGGGGDTDRAGVPGNVDLSFNVREKKKALEYEAFVTFDEVTTDENGDPQDTSHYIINWVPCTKEGNIITNEKVRQHIWSPNDDEIDDPLDPAADYYVVLPGNVPRPKVWYWKGRVRAVSTGNAKGAWSDWTAPSLPVRDSLPEPPYPDNINLTYKWKDTDNKPIFNAIVKFDDVNYWDIPGFDYEDDVTLYEVVIQPLERNDATGVIDLTGPDDTNPGGAYTDGHKYDRADPNNDGEPWEVRRQKIKDKDDDDTYVTLGTLAEAITGSDTLFDVDETGVDGTPATPFIVLTNSGERWLVYDRNLVAGNTYEYEVYRQFGDTAFQTHNNGEALTWLKDPYRYKVDFGRVERPRTVYWRAKVRSKDRFNRLGLWSPWTAPETPWQSIDWQVPKPLNLRANIEIAEYKTHPVLKLVARFNDPAPNGWNIPGGDLQDDLDRYVVVGEALINDPEGYIEGPIIQSGDLDYTGQEGVHRYFRIPDRKIGVLNAPGGVDPSATSMTVTLDADLPLSIMRILEDPDKQATYMRIQTGDVDQDFFGNEIVATTELTGAVGQDYTYDIVKGQKGSGSHGHNDGDFVYLLTEHTRRVVVHDGDEDDPGKFNKHYTANLGRIAQPRRYYWRVRALSIDSYGHRSEWTNWTDPILPDADPDLVVPYPDYVALSFDRVHRTRHVTHRPIVEWAEVDYTAPDGDREADVSRYGIQLATNDGDYLDVELEAGATSMFVNEMRKAPAPVPFFVNIEDELIQVTARTQVVENLYQYTIVRGRKETDDSYHPDGQRVFNYPFFHQTVSARQDKDPNSYNRVAFPRAERKNYYKARVRVFDRYSRESEWSPWTALGTPSDTDPPDPPENVVIDVDEHKVHVTWDYPVDPRDDDPDLIQPSVDVAFFQIQLATQANFASASILRFDRNVLGLSKTWRMRKPSRVGTYYTRVRAVDGSGNKSEWVVDSGAQNGVPTPDAPTITFDTAENSKKLRANVLLTKGVTYLDNLDNHDAEVNGYDFRLDPAENTRLTQQVNAVKTTIRVRENVTITMPYSIWIDNEKMTVTSKSGTANLIWTVTRGVGGTTPTKHRDKARVYYFKDVTNQIKQRTAEEDTPGDPVLAIFKQIHNRRYYRARVRAKDTQGRWGNFSAWSTVVRAIDLTPPDPPVNVTLRMQQHHVVVEWGTEPDPQDVSTGDSAPAPVTPVFVQTTEDVSASIGDNFVVIPAFVGPPISGNALFAILLDYNNPTNVAPNQWSAGAVPEWDKVADVIDSDSQMAMFQRISNATETGDFEFTRTTADGTTVLLGWVAEISGVPNPESPPATSPNTGLTSPDVTTTEVNQVVFHIWAVSGTSTTGASATTDSGAILPGDNGVVLTTLQSVGIDRGGDNYAWLFILPVYYETVGLKNGLTLTP